MPFIQENKIEINIGLKHEYKLIHFSDVHLVTYKETDSKEVIDEAIRCEKVWDEQKIGFAKGAGEYFDESHFIPSKECLMNLVKYSNEEKPSAVVLTGDILDYYSESNYDALCEACGMLNYPFVFSCGNHETPVERYYDLNMNDTGFVVLELNEFKIISLDNSTKKVTKDTLNNLRKELRGKKPAIISMHIPISTSYNKEEMKKYDPYFVIYEDDTDLVTKEFVKLLVTNDKVKAILCGHVHGHGESYFAPGKLQCCASSGLIGMVNKIIVK